METARLENLTARECRWLADFVAEHSDARATMDAMPWSHRERFFIHLTGVSPAEAERTLASLRAGDAPVWVDWAIRGLPEARR